MRGWLLIFLALGALTTVLLVLIHNASSASLSWIPATPTATPTVPPQRLIPAIRAPIDESAEDVIALLITLVKVLAIPFIAWVAGHTIWTIATARPGVVVEEVADGTGEQILIGFMPALTEIARDQLTAHFQDLQLKSQRHVREAPPSLGQAKAEEVGKLLSTFKDVLPKWVQSLLVLVQAVLPPLHSHVTTRVVSIGDLHGDVGVALRLDVPREDTIRHAAWESPPPPVPLPDKRKRARAMVDDGMRWVAIELWQRAALEAVDRGQ